MLHGLEKTICLKASSVKRIWLQL